MPKSPARMSPQDLAARLERELPNLRQPRPMLQRVSVGCVGFVLLLTFGLLVVGFAERVRPAEGSASKWAFLAILVTLGATHLALFSAFKRLFVNRVLVPLWLWRLTPIEFEEIGSCLPPTIRIEIASRGLRRSPAWWPLYLQSLLGKDRSIEILSDQTCSSQLRRLHALIANKITELLPFATCLIAVLGLKDWSFPGLSSFGEKVVGVAIGLAVTWPFSYTRKRRISHLAELIFSSSSPHFREAAVAIPLLKYDVVDTLRTLNRSKILDGDEVWKLLKIAEKPNA